MNTETTTTQVEEANPFQTTLSANDASPDSKYIWQGLDIEESRVDEILAHCQQSAEDWNEKKDKLRAEGKNVDHLTNTAFMRIITSISRSINETAYICYVFGEQQSKRPRSMNGIIVSGSGSNPLDLLLNALTKAGAIKEKEQE